MMIIPLDCLCEFHNKKIISRIRYLVYELAFPLLTFAFPASSVRVCANSLKSSNSEINLYLVFIKMSSLAEITLKLYKKPLQFSCNYDKYSRDLH